MSQPAAALGGRIRGASEPHIRMLGVNMLIGHNDLYEYLGIEKDLVSTFSILFSRFEYALKRTHRYAAGNEKIVWANWEQFARDHDAQFNAQKTPELSSAVQYLLNNPPQKQILRSGKLDWKPVPKENTPLLEHVLEAVRRVRNNLFHGGKFPTGPVEEPGRDTTLLRGCVTVLTECLSLNKELERHFHTKA